MRTKLLILTLVVGYTLSLFADREVRDGVIATSLVRVVANPEDYDGKRVLLKGFLQRGFEESGLYLSRDDAAILNSRQALWVGSLKDGREGNDFPDEGWVMIVGKFRYERGKGSGHMGLWLAEITDIEQIQILSADRSRPEDHLGLVEHRAVSGGVVLRVRVPRSIESEAGVEVRFSLTNGEAEPIRYMPGFADLPVFNEELEDGDGNRVPYARGDPQRLREFLLGQVLTGYGRAIELEPGEEKKWVIDLSGFYEIGPGDFVLALSVPFERQPFGHRFRGAEQIRVENASFRVE